MPPELHIGQQIEPFTIESVDPEKMKTVAAILRDPTPTHFDTEVTRALGMGDRPVSQGPLNMTWFMEAAVRVAGGRERLVHIKVRFLDNVFARERLECAGTVTAINTDEGKAELELLATADGRPVLAGTAVIRTG